MAIKIHIYLFLVAAYMYAVGKLQIFLLYYLFILMHELVHIIVALIFHIDVNEVVFLPVGANAKLGDNISAWKSFFIALAGPLGSYIFYLFFDNEMYAFFNLVICVVNLLPIFPCDGGQMLKALFEIFFDKRIARKCSIFTTKIFICLILFISATSIVYFENYYMFIFNFYICSIAKEEIEKEKLYEAIYYLQK